MPTQLQLRKVLPISQTLLAVAFGGWGLWERFTFINDSWLGWNSTLRFHVWPWPFKFAVVQNIPAFLIGLLLSWPIDSFEPGLPEWVSLLPSLLLVPLLWYLIGAWLDRKRVLGRTSRETVVLIFGVFTAVSLIVAVNSGWTSTPTPRSFPSASCTGLRWQSPRIFWDAVGRGSQSSTNFSDFRVRTKPPGGGRYA